MWDFCGSICGECVLGFLLNLFTHTYTLIHTLIHTLLRLKSVTPSPLNLNSEFRVFILCWVVSC